MLINEAAKNSGVTCVESIKLPEERAFNGIAFTFPEMTKRHGDRIREIALDSACQHLLCSR